MKVAVVYNRESKSVINLFGSPNQEKIGLKTIKRLSDSLKAGGHQVVALEGDKDLIDRLEEFMPRVLKGERPGMAFNVSYGIQGQARYTHVPSILEMVGVPYVGSGPLAHSLALDKVVAKMIFRERGVSTPDFVVLEQAGFDMPDLAFPLIVKPKNEAVSFGIQVVNNEEELRTAADVIFSRFAQPVLAEQYISGREINVGLLGNGPPDALPAAELIFGDGPQIYTYEDKTKRSGREVLVKCPAEVDAKTAERAQELAKAAFHALGCADCARVDLRMDEDGELYVLEVNSLPSLGEHGSYVHAAEAAGLDFSALVNRLVEVASSRYFGTPSPVTLERGSKTPEDQIFAYLTNSRDAIERRVESWVRQSSRTSDPVGLKDVTEEAHKTFQELKLNRVEELSDDRSTHVWQTKQGFDNGTLLIAHLDSPVAGDAPHLAFRRDPEFLYGEAIATSRSGLTMIEFALRALRSARRLRRLPIGVLLYSDEGRECRYSEKLIREAASRAKRALVLRPSNLGDRVISARRGQRKYRLRVEGTPPPPGRMSKVLDPVRWSFETFERICGLSSARRGVSASIVDIQTQAYPLHLPHRVTATLLVTYRDPAEAAKIDHGIERLLKKAPYAVDCEAVSDRPPLKERRGGLALVNSLQKIAERWDIPLGKESSLWPSVGGLVAAKTATLCGIAPASQHLYTPQESIQRISLLQRTLLLTGLLLEKGEL